MGSLRNLGSRLIKKETILCGFFACATNIILTFPVLTHFVEIGLNILLVK